MKSEEMKTIGLIGGMSFESTLTYYQIINETIRKELDLLLKAEDTDLKVYDTTRIHSEEAAYQAVKKNK